MKRTVLAAVRDLFFEAKLVAAARKAGVALVFARTVDELVEGAGRGADLVVVDLDEPAIATEEGLARLRAAAPRTPVVGYLSHVERERARAARRAGLDRVLPRSRFDRDLVGILAGEAASGEATDRVL